MESVANILRPAVSPLLAGAFNGFLHVILGPDHIAVIIAMSQFTEPWHAFQAGVHWAVSHSLGLGVIGIIFAVLKSFGVEDNFGQWVERWGGFIIGSGLVGFGIFFWLKRRWYFDENWSPIAVCRCAEDIGLIPEELKKRNSSHDMDQEMTVHSETSAICPVASSSDSLSNDSLGQTLNSMASSSPLIQSGSFSSNMMFFAPDSCSDPNCTDPSLCLPTHMTKREQSESTVASVDGSLKACLVANKRDVFNVPKQCFYGFSGGWKQMLATWAVGFVQGIACPAIAISFIFLSQYSPMQLALFAVSFVFFSAVSMGMVAFSFGWFVRRFFRSNICIKWMFILSCVFSVLLGSALFICSAVGVDLDPQIIQPDRILAATESMFGFDHSAEHLESFKESRVPSDVLRSVSSMAEQNELVDEDPMGAAIQSHSLVKRGTSVGRIASDDGVLGLEN